MAIERMGKNADHRYQPGDPVWCCGGHQGWIVDAPGLDGRMSVRLAGGRRSEGTEDEIQVLPRSTAYVPRRRLETLAWRHARADHRIRVDGQRCIWMQIGGSWTMAKPISSMSDAALMGGIPIDVLVRMTSTDQEWGSGARISRPGQA
jgi:hypothetical protein